MRLRLVAGLAAALLLFASAPAQAQVFSQRVGFGFSDPIFATSAPGDPSRLFVVEQGGLIRILNVNTGLIEATPFLNLGAVPGANLVSGGEQGLLGLTFHPDYQTNGRFYINYTSSQTFTGGSAPNGFTRVEQFTRSAGNPNVADPTSRTPILGFTQPFTNHNGGWIGFSPRDRLLYISSGDGGSGNDPQNNGQNRNNLLGKMLRIDVNSDAFPGDPNANYAIPGDNPFVGVPNTRGEIWAYGLRNPWRASFDRLNGNLWIGDVGQASFEEINFMAADIPVGGNRNYGWRLREGFDPTPSVGGTRPPDNVDPLLAYPRSIGASVTGGYVYRGTMMDSSGRPLDGAYFYGDYISRRIFSIRTIDGVTFFDQIEWTTTLRNSIGGQVIGNISSFAEDGFGNLYIIDYSDGEIFAIRSASVPEPSSWLLLSGVGVMAWWCGRKRRTD